MTWIERTAYPQFKRLTSARVLHVFFTPSSEEVAWAEQRTGSPESRFALVLALKCFQKMARFPSPDEIPDVVIATSGAAWSCPRTSGRTMAPPAARRRIASWCANVRA
ncbi:DUF4158 domain-containing protein [Nonomuraea sp. B5E05]|uniref:DUF4158 domain-containing protein n=1 Tax=Nonomuraea sp. B5E05 TaxID=3153569 RepID=UPI003261470B